MSKNIESGNKEKSVVMKVLIGLKDYLTDWKNLLGHALLGVGLLVIAIWHSTGLVQASLLCSTSYI